MTVLDGRALLFRTAERTFLAEIKRLRRTIGRLTEIRKVDIAALNKELSLEGTGLDGDRHPQHPLCKYDNSRLTARGVEICYRLFDIGRSPMAVAHLANLSLVAARRRQRLWTGAGGRNRPKVDIAALPRRKFYARNGD